MTTFKSLEPILHRLAQAKAQGELCALATVVASSGSTPQQIGSRLLLTAKGDMLGTVGGGAVEHRILECMRTHLKNGASRLYELDLVRDLGMCCGGRMSILVESISQDPRLFIFGAGHVGLALANIARSLHFQLFVIDDREELNNAERFPDAERILLEPREAVQKLSPTENDFLVVTTHDHRLDEEALSTYANLPHRYLGLIGSKRKIVLLKKRIEQRLNAANTSLPDFSKVFAPIGFDIGAVSPEEIAISVAAELIAIRHGKSGPSMRLMDLSQSNLQYEEKHELSEEEIS